MISNGQQKTTEVYKGKKNSDVRPQFEPLDKYNWYIYRLYILREIESCQEFINKELKRSGGRNEFAVFMQGEIYQKDGKLQEALDTFQTYLKMNPDSADCLKHVAKCLYDMRRYKLAVEAYLEAEEKLENNPDWQVYYYLGQCFMKLGDLSKAKEYANKAVKIAKHEMCYAFVVKILTTEGNFNSALDVSLAAVEFCPDSVKMLTECGLLHLKVGQIQQAVEKLSSALALDPTYKKALLAIGYITQKHSEYDASLSKYKMAVQFEPDSIALWNNIGLCFYSKQKYVAAISCLKKALWLQPLNWKTLINISLAFLGTLQPASAFNFACASVNLRPDIAESFNILGAALIDLNDPVNAAQAVIRAVELAPSDGITILNAAVCCYNAELIEEAVGYMRKFQEIVEQDQEPLWFTQEVRYIINLLAMKLKDYGSFEETNPPLTSVQEMQEEDKKKNDAGFIERTLGEDEV